MYKVSIWFCLDLRATYQESSLEIPDYLDGYNLWIEDFFASPSKLQSAPKIFDQLYRKF